MKKKILIGNTWPTTLIRRSVRIDVISIGVLKEHIRWADEVYSFWGHQNTIAVANKLLGIDVTPKKERPAISLTSQNLPIFEDEVFWQVFLLNPDYRPGFRPQIGQEVGEADITGWACLKVTYIPEFDDRRDVI